jgi:hypothetical protein
LFMLQKIELIKNICQIYLVSSTESLYFLLRF